MLRQFGRSALLIFIVFGLLVLLVSSFLFAKSKTFDSTTEVPLASIEKEDDLDKYSSDLFDLSISVPEGFAVREGLNELSIYDSMGEVQLRKIGTNFSNIDGYVSNLKEKNKVAFLSETSGKVGDWDSLVITMQDPNNKDKILKEYFLYIENRIYKFSTSEEMLYPVLDEIVQSFEYRP